jgi:acyl transferase domain-containing protein
MNNETGNIPEGVAIIGVAGRFPGAGSLAQFWENLCAGRESIVFFDEPELAAAGVPAALLRDPQYVRAAARLQDVEWFDAGFFGYSPKEAAMMDPQQRVFLECAWEALEEAGYAPGSYEGSIGVYAGAAINSYMAAYAHRLGSLEGDVLATFLGNAADFLSTRVSYKLDLRGPSLNIQTACSTSLVAVHLAVQSVASGECDMALAGGVSIKVTPTPGYFYQPGGIASPDGHCRAFDAKAAGTLFGDGAGVVVLKRVAEAIEDGDHIYAVIRGSAINNDGASKVGYTAPSVNGQAAVVAEALAMAGVTGESISYVEAHGTGTALGDPVEIAALTKAFRVGPGGRGRCAIGSLKTNIGQLDAAAGIAGLIKTVMALHYGKLPPSLHYETPNPEIDFAGSPFFVNASLREWRSEGGPRRAGVSSFGMGGTNAHVVVEEAPAVERKESEATEMPLQLLTLAAKTPGALEAMAGRYARYFAIHPDVNLADAAFTAQVGRTHFACRMAVAASTVEQARELLTLAVAGRAVQGVYRSVEGRGEQPEETVSFGSEGGRFAELWRAAAAAWFESARWALRDRC